MKRDGHVPFSFHYWCSLDLVFKELECDKRHWVILSELLCSLVGHYHLREGREKRRDSVEPPARVNKSTHAHRSLSWRNDYHKPLQTETLQKAYRVDGWLRSGQYPATLLKRLYFSRKRMGSYRRSLRTRRVNMPYVQALGRGKRIFKDSVRLIARL